MTLAPQPGVMEIAAYAPGAAHAEGARVTRKLSSNENPLGPGAAARAAVVAAAASLERYPDGGATALRAALGARWRLDPARIVCGAGSDELLALLCQAYVGPGDETVMSDHGFLMYRISTLASGGRSVAAPESGLRADVDALLAAVNDRTRIMFLANPNNPTGSYLDAAELRRLRAGLRDDVLLVIDAAYAEYVAAEDYDAGAALVEAHDNVVMTRTFSKLYGLAALRAGWAYCPPAVADALNRVRGPFNLSAPAQAAAIAALGDRDHEAASLAHNNRWRPWLADALAGLGLEVAPSAANFILVRFPDDPARNAAAADAWLTRCGLLVRRMEAYGLAPWLRMTIGTEDDNRALAEALAAFMRGDA